jgi:hypothetical protein
METRDNHVCMQSHSFHHTCSESTIQHSCSEVNTPESKLTAAHSFRSWQPESSLPFKHVVEPHSKPIQFKFHTRNLAKLQFSSAPTKPTFVQLWTSVTHTLLTIGKLNPTCKPWRHQSQEQCNLGTRYRRLFSLTLRPLYPQRKCLRHPLNKETGGPQTQKNGL